VFYKKETNLFSTTTLAFLVDFYNVFAPFETYRNDYSSRHKHCHFNLTMSPFYLVKLKIAQKLSTAYCSAVRSTGPIVPNFRRKSFSIVCRYCLVVVINRDSMKNISLNSNIVIC